jgi:PAS domain S-box-containing protein
MKVPTSCESIYVSAVTVQLSHGFAREVGAGTPIIDRTNPAAMTGDPVRVLCVDDAGATAALRVALADRDRVGTVDTGSSSTAPSRLAHGTPPVDCVVLACASEHATTDALAHLRAAAPSVPVLVRVDDATDHDPPGATDVFHADAPPARVATRVLAHADRRRAARDWTPTGGGTTAGDRLARPGVLLESIVDALQDVLYVLDGDGTFQRWNDSLSTVTGYDDATLAGTDATRVIAPEDRPTIAEAIASVYADGTRERREVELLTESGERIPYQVSGAPLRAADGTIVGVVGVGRDISGRRLRTERLNVLTRVLRHNLRNDMNSILGHARLVAEGLPPEADHESIDWVIGTAERLERLAEKVYSVETALADDPTPSPTRLRSVVESGLARVEPPAAGTVEVDVPDVRIRAVDDAGLAVAEAVRNAVEHGDRDDPWIRVAAHESARSTDWITLRVADDGHPIPPGERRVLVEGESPLEHGSGIGLWLINWIVTASGGQLHFARSDRGGSEVRMRFHRVATE